MTRTSGMAMGYGTCIASVCCLLAMLAILPSHVAGNALDDMLTTTVTQEPCVKLMNAFTDIGCSSMSSRLRLLQGFWTNFTMPMVV